jgi:hypothetical protein
VPADGGNAVFWAFGAVPTGCWNYQPYVTVAPTQNVGRRTPCTPEFQAKVGETSCLMLKTEAEWSDPSTPRLSVVLPVHSDSLLAIQKVISIGLGPLNDGDNRSIEQQYPLILRFLHYQQP